MNNNSNEIKKIIAPQVLRLNSFCHATICGDTIYISGMIPSKTGGNTLVEGGMASQTTQCLINIEHVLEECGAKWSNVAKLSVFMDNFDGNGDKEKARVQFAEYNNAYLKFFEERNVPVCGRITVGAKGLALGCMIEIDGIAYLPKSKF